ncbi:MAG: glycosyltransferase involved in cell wall biosynthesis [Candidatus Paceibacteria bacterium]
MTRAAWRIGFVLGLDWNEPGGVQRVTAQLAREFMRQGHSVFVLSLSSAGDSRRMLAGVHLQELMLPEAAESARDLDRNPRLERLALAWCVDNELDVIHLQHLSGFGLGLPKRLRELGRPTFLSLHDDWLVCPRGQMWHVDDHSCEEIVPETCSACWTRTWPKLQEMEPSAVQDRLQLARDAVSACEEVFVPSQAAREVALAWGAPADSLSVLENPVQALRAPADRIEFDPECIRIGVLGSVQPSKGVLPFARWIVELGAPFQLEIHGPRVPYHGDGRELEELQTLVDSSARVRTHGTYDALELPGILSQLHLVCVPSLWHEVHGLVAREARQAGLAVFVSDRGGLRSAPAHVLPAGDGEAWKQALQRFASDAEWRAALVQQAPEFLAPAQAAQALLGRYGAAMDGDA